MYNSHFSSCHLGYMGLITWRICGLSYGYKNTTARSMRQFNCSFIIHTLCWLVLYVNILTCLQFQIMIINKYDHVSRSRSVSQPSQIMRSSLVFTFQVSVSSCICACLHDTMPSFIKDSHSKWKYCGFADIHIFPILYISPLVMFRLPDSIFLHFKEKWDYQQWHEQKT